MRDRTDGRTHLRLRLNLVRATGYVQRLSQSGARSVGADRILCRSRSRSERQGFPIARGSKFDAISCTL